MKGKTRISFKGNTSAKWLNLLLAVLVTFFLVNLIQPLIQGDWCKQSDYCGYYSAGVVMNNGKIADVYDLQILEEYQFKVFQEANSPEPRSEIIAMLYLPVFLIPFRLLALLNLSVSVIVWLVINFSILTAYLFFFAEKVSGKSLPLQIYFLILASLPVFRNFYDGQINVWLLICIGEFLRASLSKRPWVAGLWLGGLLVKPQLLILVLPFLLIQKRFKEIIGFIISSGIVMGLSLTFVGFDGLVALKDVMLEAGQGGVSSASGLMINWRMVSQYIELLSPVVGKTVLFVLSAVTALLPLIAFRKRIMVDSPISAVALLGVMAATTAVAFHMHVHTAMLLIPILLYLLLKESMEVKWLIIWSLAPALMYFLQYFIIALVLQGIVSMVVGYPFVIMYGVGMLVVNMILLIWSLKHPSGVKKVPTLEQPA